MLKYGVRGYGPDHNIVFGCFGSRSLAIWYANSEFGVGNYRLVVLDD